VINSELFNQVGSFRGSYIHEDTLILSSKSGLVVFDLASYNWLDSTTNVTEAIRSMFFSTGFVPIIPYYDVARNRIIVASESTNNPQLSLLDFATLELIPAWQLINETASNPKSASSLGGVFRVVASDSYLYYASVSTTQFNIARYPLDSWSADPVIFFTNASIIPASRTFARDSLTGYLYVGTNDGRVVRIQTNDDDFSNSIFDALQVTNQRLSTLEVDSLRGSLYVTTAGASRFEPAVVFKIDLTSWSVVENITLETFDFSVSTSAIVDSLAGGLLYLGTQQSPSRVIQIDLSRFVREVAYFLPDASSQGLDTAVFDLKRNVVWFGTIDPLTVSPSAITISGAEPCLGNCFEHGECVFRSCNCTTGEAFGYTLDWMQPWCQFLNCPDPSCNGHGYCANASCVCEPEWTSFDCTIKQCPNNCTGPDRGTCRYENGEPVACECVEGWQGSDCSVAQPTPCDKRLTCDECTSTGACGWCETSGLCIDGDAVGPADGTGCRAYHHLSCPNLGIPVLNYIFTAFVGIILLINIITMIKHDSKGVPSKRAEWYRFQRSSKAWSMVWQLQWIAAISLVSYNFPSIFVNFSTYWQWIMLGFGQPWLPGPRVVNIDETTGQRQILSVPQFLTYAYSPIENLFVQYLIWWGVAAGAVFVGLLVSVIIWKAKNRDNISQTLGDRFVYCLLRVVELGYFGLVVFSAAQLVNSSASPGMGALAGILFCVVGVGYPVIMTLIVVKAEKKKLFEETFKARVFPYYGRFAFQKVAWTWLPWGKKLLLGIAIGFFVNDMTVQLSLAIVIFVLYLVAIIVIKPHADYLEQILELVINSINLVAIPFIFAFLNEDLPFNGQATLAMIIIYILLMYLTLIACFSFYFVSWFQMREIYSWNQLSKFLKPEKN
jgi:hypothetical protein